MEAQRSPKGSVGIENLQGRLRLRLPRQLYGGNQKYLTLGLSDNPQNRKEAERKARVIELDILADNFDPTLIKYRSKSYLKIVEPTDKLAVLTLDSIWAKYCEVKKPTLSPGTWKNGYLVMTKHLTRCPEKSLDQSARIYDWAVANLTPDTAKRFIMHMSACCNWAKRHKLIADNPFSDMERIKLKKCSNEEHEVNPFNQQERDSIIQAFATNRYYKHYEPFVRFLFFTGCRPSEAIALQWKHIGKSKILFQQAVVASEQGLTLKKGLKTQDEREFPIGSQLHQLLEAIKPDSLTSESLVFPSPSGGWIDIHNFRNRAWKTILDSLDIEYRKPDQIRHTFISQQKALGVEDDQLAKTCGTSIATIHKHYAGTIKQVQFYDM